MTGYLLHAFIYLLAAVIAVPIAKRLGLGSVLGYLIAGVVIGPIAGFVGSEANTIQHFAEFGVVMMLFLVGLELEPRMLWQMRHRLIGLGGLQVGLTTLLFTSIGILADLDWRIALTIGLIFSLSSTAIVLQTFNEKSLSKTEGGKASFSVLLFQDIAVIPMLAIIPFLAIPELATPLAATIAESHEELSLVAHLSGWAHGLVVIFSIAAVIFAGHYLCPPLFKVVAETGIREIFTATVLMLVIGIAALMNLVGLSPALGTFLAGVVLANSQFRHELESDLEPFKGLLLGLFFITVGAGLDFSIISENLLLILLVTFGVIAGKASVLFILATIFKLRTTDRWLLTLSLAQAGEFGFVLLNFTVQSYALPPHIAQILSPVVTLSMLFTPLLFILYDKVFVPRYEESSNPKETDEIDEQSKIIIVGIGRFGQIVNRLLSSNGMKATILDNSAAIIDQVKSINLKSYYGDATRPDLLHTAGIKDAKLLVVAIDDKYAALSIVSHVKKTHPYIQVLVRAFDRGDYYQLKQAGADYIVVETFYSALELGAETLRRMNVHPFQVEQAKRQYVTTEKAHHNELYDTWIKFQEDKKYAQTYTELFIALEKAMANDMSKERLSNHTGSERAWTPPPKNYQNHLAQETSELN